MAVRTHVDIDWNVAVLAALVILQAAVDDIQDDVDDLTTNLAIANAAIVVIDNIVDSINAITEAEGVLEETGGTITSVLATEVTVYVNNAPSGVFIPRTARISTANHTVTETITIKLYYRNVSGGALELEDWETYAGAIAAEGIPIRLDANRFGVEITLELDAGTPRAYVWEVLEEV